MTTRQSTETIVSDCITHKAIRLAAQQGYRADLIWGRLYGRSGERLSVKKYGDCSYPTVRLHVRGLPKPAYSVYAHKFVAYLIWGEQALSPDLEVRHLDGNTENIRRSNLLLGTSSQNQMDKPPATRQAAAKAARAAQGHYPCTTILSEAQVVLIHGELVAGTTVKGRVRRGVVKALAEKFGVHKSTISLIGKGKSWNALLS